MVKEPDKKQLEEMLRELKGSASLSPYALTVYGREPAHGAPPSFERCCSTVQDQFPCELSQHFLDTELEEYFRQGVPSVLRHDGLLAFVVPFRFGGAEFCLIAFQRGAVEASEPASEEMEETAREVAEEISRLNREWCGRAAPKEAGDPEQTDPRLHAVAEALEQLDLAKTLAETVALASETIIANFQIAGLALALREADGASYQVSGLWGLPEELGFFPAEAISVFLSRSKVKKTVPYDARMRSVLPALPATLCNLFPLQSQEERLGFFAIVDTELRKGEVMLVSMVAQAAAARLSRIIKEAEQAKANAMSGRLMSLANTLLLVDNKEDLYEAILAIASDLIEATQGSIMLIDKNGKSMHIACSHGISHNVAQSISTRVGKGIAGRVALTGEPLLVNDVEKDLRVAISNRPRFKSKSLVCVPLKLKERIIGVLNLADKKNLAVFTDTDLQLLTSFANLASLMIERTMVLEESVKFEQLSVTDSLTGLYNRRFLKSRLEEELSRSIRQDLHLTVLFIDLDMFKSYNDVCGHIAGDEALKKTAEIIKSSLREMDIVARYGGEEFCAVLPGTSKPEAVIVAERIRKQIENENFNLESDFPCRRMTASLGVATFPEDGRTFKALVHASDMALYQAKASGRNRTVAATPPPPHPEPEATITIVHPPSEPAAERVDAAATLDFSSYLHSSFVSGD